MHRSLGSASVPASNLSTLIALTSMSIPETDAAGFSRGFIWPPFDAHALESAKASDLSTTCSFQGARNSRARV